MHIRDVMYKIRGIHRPELCVWDDRAGAYWSHPHDFVSQARGYNDVERVHHWSFY
jgi:hypothetical protein